jgi:uncharacterized protein (TIGR04551 family)
VTFAQGNNGRLRLALASAALLLTPLIARSAGAQMGPGGGGFGSPGGGMQPPPQQGGEKEEGPAEEAPEESHPADLEPLTSYPEQNKRKMQIFELDGYLRLRDDYIHDFFLGLGYSTVPSGSTVAGTTNYGLPPFPVPLDCPSPASTHGVIHNPMPGGSDAGFPGGNCPVSNMGGANLRFRLEPTLNVSDQVRIHAQIDVFDNTILGSTPDSLAGIQGFNTPPPATPASSTAMPGVAPSGFLSQTQDPPEIGQNGYTSSIRAKRAWAEIDTEFGSLYFGRMPWHWGRGIFYNDGNCADCDVGTTVDRVMAMTTLYGHQLKFAWDLGAQGTTTQQLSLGRLDPSGYPYDLSQDDDVLELMGSIAKLDSPVELREKIDRGDVVVNYGLQFVYRDQGAVDSAPTMAQTMGTSSLYGPQPVMPDQIPTSVPFNGISFTPDLWFKLYYKALTIEAEGVAILGRILHPGILAENPNQELTLAQAGWVVASELRLFHDAFFVGFEVGGATGDQANNPGQYLNYRWKFVQQPNGDTSINDFHFSPDYHVDEIFFRHIYGTVTNATYFKPQAAYWFDLGKTRSIGVNGGAIFSMAQVPVSTPGDALAYGIETDASLGYRNTAEGFYAGLTWGVFWPLAALDRPFPLWGQDASNASSAQILRINFGVKF